MKKLSILIILVILVGGGIYLFGGDAEDTDTVTEEVAEVVEEAKDDSMEQEGDDHGHAATSYKLDVENTKLEWSAKRIASPPHTGTISVVDGSLSEELEEGGSRHLAGEFTIDMETIAEDKNNDRFLGHVRSDDFFGVEQFPTAKFVVKAATLSSVESVYTVTGDLTIRDKTNEIAFDAKRSEEEGGLTYTAEFEIDRTKWGVNFDSGSIFTNLGDKAIKDEIALTLTLALNETE